VEIELRYWAGCPSYPEARELIDDVLREHELEAQVAVREVRSEDEAEALGFVGSPTILVDGRDVDPEGASGARPALTCRVYRIGGEVSPIPSRQQLEAALR
jgi:hypothetical protein